MSENRAYLANGGEDVGLSGVVAVSTDSQVQLEGSGVRSELHIDTKDRIGWAHLDLRPEALLAVLRALRHDLRGASPHGSASLCD